MDAPFDRTPARDRYSIGETPYRLRKDRLKCAGPLKPQEKAIWLMALRRNAVLSISLHAPSTRSPLRPRNPVAI